MLVQALHEWHVFGAMDIGFLGIHQNPGFRMSASFDLHGFENARREMQNQVIFPAKSERRVAEESAPTE
jgi:hypothetical protein